MTLGNEAIKLDDQGVEHNNWLKRLVPTRSNNVSNSNLKLCLFEVRMTLDDEVVGLVSWFKHSQGSCFAIPSLVIGIDTLFERVLGALKQLQIQLYILLLVLRSS